MIIYQKIFSPYPIFFLSELKFPPFLSLKRETTNVDFEQKKRNEEKGGIIQQYFANLLIYVDLQT